MVNQGSAQGTKTLPLLRRYTYAHSVTGGTDSYTDPEGEIHLENLEPFAQDIYVKVFLSIRVTFDMKSVDYIGTRSCITWRAGESLNT